MNEFEVLAQMANLMDSLTSDEHERVIAWLGTREQQRRRTEAQTIYTASQVPGALGSRLGA